MYVSRKQTELLLKKWLERKDGTRNNITDDDAKLRNDSRSVGKNEH